MLKTTQPTVSVLQLCYKFFLLRRIHFDLGCNKMRAGHSAPLCCFSCLSWTQACSAHDIRSELLKILDSRSAFVTCDLIAQRLLITDVIIHFKVQGSSVRTFNDLPEWSVSHFVLSFLIFLHLHFFLQEVTTHQAFIPPLGKSVPCTCTCISTWEGAWEPMCCLPSIFDDHIELSTQLPPASSRQPPSCQIY